MKRIDFSLIVYFLPFEIANRVLRNTKHGPNLFHSDVDYSLSGCNLLKVLDGHKEY